MLRKVQLLQFPVRAASCLQASDCPISSDRYDDPRAVLVENPNCTWKQIQDLKGVALLEES